MPGVFPPARMKKAGKGFFADDYWSLVRVRLRFQISLFSFASGSLHNIKRYLLAFLAFYSLAQSPIQGGFQPLSGWFG